MPLEISLELSVFGQVELDLLNRKFNSAMMRLTSMSSQFSKNISYLKYLSQALRAMGDQSALIKTLKELNRQQHDLKTEIEIIGNLPEEQRTRMLQIAQLCPVHKMLARPIEIE